MSRDRLRVSIRPRIEDGPELDLAAAHPEEPAGRGFAERVGVDLEAPAAVDLATQTQEPVGHARVPGQAPRRGS